MQSAVPNTSDLALVIQKGTWETVGEVTPEIGDPTLADFRASIKTRITVGDVPNKERTARFKDYSPAVFKRLRALFGVDPGDYLCSISGAKPLYSLPSAGKSGAQFFYTHDGSYIVKSMRHTEALLLRRILPAYYSHFVRHPHTLISRYFALFRLDLGGNKQYFCVMNNVFDTPRDLPVSAVFDLKGSTYSRITAAEKRARGAVMKDLDFLELGHRVRLAPARRALLLRQLQIDSDFLASLGLIDYSLLLGIHEFRATSDHRVIFRGPEEQADAPADSPAEELAEDAASAVSTVSAESSEGSTTPKAPLQDEMWICSPLVVARGGVMSPRASSHLSRAAAAHEPSMPSLAPFQTSSFSLVRPASPAVQEEAPEDVKAYAAAQRARAVIAAADRDPAAGFSLGDLTNPSASLFAPSSWVLSEAEAAHAPARHGGLRSVFQCEDGGLRSESGEQVYFFGVIDLLTPYTSRKRMERRLKRFWQGEGVSVAPPAFFAERFVHFARDKVLAPLAHPQPAAHLAAPRARSGSVAPLGRLTAPAALRRMSVSGTPPEYINSDPFA